MAIPCLHKAAQQYAAEANAKVDEKQGSDAGQANLHAMCGLIERSPQSDSDCRNAVFNLIKEGRREIVEAIALELDEWSGRPFARGGRQRRILRFCETRSVEG